MNDSGPPTGVRGGVAPGVALCPGIAHWTAGTPVTGVMPVPAVGSVYRRFVVDGRPVAAGLLSVGDAWASARQAFGLGLSMDPAHAILPGGGGHHLGALARRRRPGGARPGRQGHGMRITGAGMRLESFGDISE